MRLWFTVLSILCCSTICCTTDIRDNWAIVVATSRYWFNYRHLANAISMYNIVKSMGIPDSHIIFMNTLDIINDARNPMKGDMFISETISNVTNLMGNSMEIDYIGNEFTVDLFLRLLTDRLPSYVPKSKRLLSTNTSNILIYMSGHGGDEFFKFHDAEELSASDLGDAVREMHLKQRYRSILFVLETCQAVTMTNYLSNIPNVITIASSLKGENSYAYGSSKELGVAVVDRFTYSVDDFFQKNFLNQLSSKQYCDALTRYSLNSLLSRLTPSFLYSTATIVQSKEGDSRSSKDILLSEYFSDYKTQKMKCKQKELLSIDSISSEDSQHISDRRKDYLNKLIHERLVMQ